MCSQAFLPELPEAVAVVLSEVAVQDCISNAVLVEAGSSDDATDISVTVVEPDGSISGLNCADPVAGIPRFRVLQGKTADEHRLPGLAGNG